MRVKKRPGIVLSVVATTSGLATSATTARAEPLAVSEELIVTAPQKREEKLQSVAAAVSVLNDKDLRWLGQGATRATELGDLVAGLVVESQGAQRGNFTIRGVGTRDTSPHNEGATVLFVDGAYVSWTEAVTVPMFDIQRVEVLKGPQGTLYGRNATGGLLHIITKKPRFEFDAYTQAYTGSFGLVGAEGAVGGRLSDTVAGRLSLYGSQRDGFIDNLLGEDQEAVQNYSGRGQLLFQPNDKTELLLNARFSTYRPQASRGYDTAPLILAPGGQLRPPASRQEYANYCNSLRAPLGGGQTGAPVAPAGSEVRGNCRFAQLNGDTWTTSTRTPTSYYSDYAGASATLDVRFADTLQFTSITDYQMLDAGSFNDVDSSPADLLNFATNTDTSQISQELRLSRQTDGSVLLGGLYLLDIQGSYSPTFDVQQNPMFLGVRLDAPFDQDTRSYAAFVAGEYDLTSTVTLIGGARWTEDRKSLSQPASRCTDNFGGATCQLLATTVFPPGSLAFSGFTGDISKGDWAGELKLRWSPSDWHMVYAGLSRGNKSGGFNAGAGVFSTTGSVPYRNEVLNAIEIGSKSTFLYDSTTLNAAVFVYDYNGYQTYSVANNTLVVFNNDAKVKGAEFELASKLYDSLTLRLGGTWLDAMQINVPTPIGLRDIVMPASPRFTGYARVRYEWQAFGGEMNATADGAYLSERSSDALDPPALRLPAYFRANVGLGYESSDSPWSARLWVNNVTNEEVATFRLNLAAVTGGLQTVWDPPRTYGVTLAYQWE